ncbi:MAG: DnaJ C-terminal domain-containing protein [bacterium]
MTNKDLYKILGVSDKASADEIKRTYKKLAKEFHPDKNKGNKTAEERFKEISEAYSVLGNTEKRAKYDQLRNMGAGAYHFAGEGVSWDDIFEKMGGAFRTNDGGYSFSFSNMGNDFSIDDLFSSFFGSADFSSRQKKRPAHGSDIRTTITIPFQVAVEGGRIELNIPTETKCSACNGTGHQGGAHSQFCLKCKGAGRVEDIQKIAAKIPAGIDDGATLRLKGKGNAGPTGGAAGDLYVTVQVQDDPNFKRKDADVYVEKTINLAQAVLGTQVRIQTPYSKNIDLRIPAGTQPGHQFRLSGIGIHTTKKTGDMFVTIKVEIPKNLTAKQRELVEKLAKSLSLDV